MKNFGINQFGVKKYLNGTDENGILLLYKGPQYRDVVERIKKENPEAYNKILIEVAKKTQPNSEIIRWIDSDGNTKTTTNVVGMSAADPIATDIVLGVALGKPLLWVGNKAFPIIGKMLRRNPYKNISINGNALTSAQVELLEQSKKQLISKGVKRPTQAQIVNNSNLGFTVPENFYSGVNATQPEILTFNGNIWMSDNKDVYTYFSNRNYPGSNSITNRFLAGFPKSAKVKEIDFKGDGFRGDLDSDGTVRDAVKNGFDVVKQNNIVELTSPGTNIIIPEGTDRLIISKKPKLKYLDWDWLKFNYL